MIKDNVTETILSAVILASVLTLSHALLRSAATFPSLEIQWTIRVGAALFLYTIVFFAYSLLLKRFEISILYPAYTALSIIGVGLVGMLYFSESVSLTKVVGYGFLIIGTFLALR